MLYGNKFKNGGDNSIYTPEELAGIISRYNAGKHGSEKEELTNFLYWLFAVCQNEYNADYFRVFYVALSDLIEDILNHSGLNTYKYLWYGNNNNKGV